MTYEQRNCREFLLANSRKFGITETAIGSEYLDIVARNVRCIASRRIDEKIVLPSMCNILNSCTGCVDNAGGIDTQFASLRVTHAKEELVNCDCDCPGVKVTIKGQIIVRSKSSCNPCCPPSYMAIPVELVSEVIRDFYSTATGEKIAQLKNELPHIDGSCMVINLNCRVYREVCNGCSRYVAHVKGSVVDKLWKLENVWVEGIRPYQSPAITVCDTFAKDICTCYDDAGYIRMATQQTAEAETTAEAGCATGCGCTGGCNAGGCGCANLYNGGCTNVCGCTAGANFGGFCTNGCYGGHCGTNCGGTAGCGCNASGYGGGCGCTATGCECAEQTEDSCECD